MAICAFSVDLDGDEERSRRDKTIPFGSQGKDKPSYESQPPDSVRFVFDLFCFALI